MTEKLHALYAVLDSLQKNIPEEEAKALLRQCLPLFLDLSPTEVEDALEWLKDRTSLSTSWLKAYQQEIKKASQKAKATAQGSKVSPSLDNLVAVRRLHSAQDFPDGTAMTLGFRVHPDGLPLQARGEQDGTAMTLGFRVHLPEGGGGHLLLVSDGARVSACLNPKTMEIGGREWQVEEGTPPWLEDRWSLAGVRSLIEAPSDFPGLHERLQALLRQYLDLPAPAYGLLTAWAVGTYLSQLFTAFPFLHFLGPKEAGKSKTLEALRLLCFNAFKGRDLTAAALGDTCEGQRGTMLFDQAERVGQGDHGAANLVGLLADSYKKAGGRRRVVEVTKAGRRVLEFSTYGPKAFASTKPLDPDLADRCLRLPMTRTRKPLPDLEGSEPVWAGLRDACYRFALLRFREVAQAYRDIPGDGTRLRELWRPLKAVLQGLEVKAEEVAEIYDFFLASTTDNRHEPDAWEEALLETLREKALAASGPFEMTAEDILQGMGLEGEVKPGPRWLGNALSQFNLYAQKLPRRWSTGDRRRKVQPYLFHPDQVIRIYEIYMRDTPQNAASHASHHENGKEEEELHGTQGKTGTRPPASQEPPEEDSEPFQGNEARMFADLMAEGEILL